MPEHKPARLATLADVGRAAGVSAAAVSATLNRADPPWPVSRATRERIIAAASALQYRPNGAARALSKRRTHTLGVVAVVEGGELNDYFLEVLNGILPTATRRGQNITVFTLPNWNDGAAGLRRFCDGRIDGLILLAPTFVGREIALPKHTPVVSVHANSAAPGLVNIEADEEHGASLLVRHLIAAGHRRILHLSGPPGLIGAERRISGYRRALADAGIDFDPDLVVAAGYTTPLGRDAMASWLRAHRSAKLPDAVFCANDAAAIGCLEALAELQVRVPHDVSVAGFEDTYNAKVVVPQLTSVRQPLAEMGAHAVELLLARIERPSELAASVTVVFPVSLILRASVAPNCRASNSSSNGARQLCTQF